MLVRYLKVELLRLARNRRFIILSSALPVAFYLLWANVFSSSGGPGMSAAVYLLVSMGSFGVILASLSATAVPLATERSAGWLRQLRVTPLRTWNIALVKLAASLLLVLPSLLLICLAGVLTQHVHLSAAEWGGYLLAMWVGALPYLALGLIIGSLVGPDAAQPLAMVVMFLLSILGGLWTPSSELPTVLRRIGNVLPSNHFGHIGWHIVAGHMPATNDLVTLGAWTVGLAIVALFAFRRVTATA